MRARLTVQNVRRVLCVFPSYAPAFGTFSHALKLMGAKAFMPPQGLLVIAAYLPPGWQVRFIDENIAPATSADINWADAVFVTGMHIQAAEIHAIAARAHAAGKVTVLGGPSVSGAPQSYPDYDYLHIGELGDATDRLIARLDEAVARPPAQQRFATAERLPLSDFPIPAYDLIRFDRYLLGTLQFSSGCPYQCEFCDIPNLYGRQPRLKTPEQLIAELDFILAQKAPPAAIYFVDDNFIGNRKATREMLPHLVAWQQRHRYPITFSCEATLNLAKQAPILKLMRTARFDSVFVGIETPELGALAAMHKQHNAALPMMEAIGTLNRHGMEVVSGIILGLDSDTADTEQRLKEFIDQSRIPMLTMNLLQALPRTPLWDRLASAGRLIEDGARESNVAFLRPHDEVVASWRRCIAHAYDPERLYARFMHQLDATYAHRLPIPPEGQATWPNIRRGLRLALNLLLRVGVRADYRRWFWRAARAAWKRGQIDSLMSIGFVSYHLIEFSREALRGEQNASFYSARARETVPAMSARRGAWPRVRAAP
ncbi:MAG TPA: B12-binding domain-containing radical SAM protein [Steroidobacteraceae bacterium]|nr:B12-binding domain-containing radical SAM protein [Steroidobacteraceae bacterium]